MDDKKIVELYFERDEKAIAETQKKYQRYLTKIAFNILADREDCLESVNDTYLAAWNSIPPNRPNVLSTYLAKLTRRISIDIFRKRKSEKRKSREYSLSLSELSDISSPDTPETELFTKILGEKISDFLRGLSPEARCAFIGRYYFLDSVKEVSRYCNMSEGKLKSLLFRTRLALKEYLKKEGYEI